MTKNNDRNEYTSNLLTRTNRRASLVPTAAVIPGPVAYIKVIADKKLVVRTRVRGHSRGPGAAAPSSVVDFGRPCAFLVLSAGVDCHVYLHRGPAGENLLLRRGGGSRRAGCRGDSFRQMQRTVESRRGRKHGLSLPLPPPSFLLPPSFFPTPFCFPLRQPGHCFVVRAYLQSGGFSSQGALDPVSAVTDTFTLKKLECSSLHTISME